MIKKIILFCFVGLSYQLLISNEQCDMNRDKFGLETFFNSSSMMLLKTLIKDVYAPNQPPFPVVVQTTTNLCKEEQRFLKNRLPIVQQNLKTFFNIDKPLRIGFCCSGGGNRSMIGTLGLLTGAARSHVLDVTLYLTGLSGSTWLLSQFCFLAATSYKKQSYEKILADIKECYSSMLSDYSMIHSHGIYAPPLISFDSTDDVCVEVAKRWAYEQPITLVNLFGALVSDYALCLLGNDRLSEKLSRIMIGMQKGTVPMPLCASIFEKSPLNYGWFEMSPLQCGSADLGYIPVEYLGSNFINGTLNENSIFPEYPLSFFLGMYGSAFALTVQDIANAQQELSRKITILKEDNKKNNNFDLETNRNILNNQMIQGIIKTIIKDIITGRNSLTYAHFPNFSQGVNSSVLKDESVLGLFDAGMAFDLPLPLLIDREERNLDIIFLYSSFPGQKSSLKALEKYCTSHNKKFPDLSIIDEQDLEEDDMTILNDPRSVDYDLTIPTYIYFPTNNIDLYSSPYITLNFRYTAEEVDSLSNKTNDVFMLKIDVIKEIFQLVASKKYENKQV